MPAHLRLPADRALALAASIHTLRSLWLRVTCCGATTVLPLKLAHASGVRGTLADMVLRLVCKRCGASPERAMLIDRADGPEINYAPPGWRLVVLERPPAPQHVQAVPVPPS